MLLFVSLMGFISDFWYIGAVGLTCYLLSLHFRPVYTRFTGFLGKHSDQLVQVCSVCRRSVCRRGVCVGVVCVGVVCVSIVCV